MDNNVMRNLLDEFDITAEITGIKQISAGLINDTYKVTVADGKKYTVQRINVNVFKEPEKVMSNIKTVADYIDENNIDESVCGIQRFLSRKNGDNYLITDDSFYRIADFIEGVTYDTVPDSELLYNAGFAFGNFQNMLDGIDMDKLYETIPDFHNTAKRFDVLFESVEKNESGRAESCAEEIEFLRKNRELAGTLTRLKDEGKIPLRVTHNDTKYNNIVINPETGKAVCVIDLDTIMPGIIMNDYGDAIRFAANTAIEDDPDLSKVSLNLEYFEKFTAGYMSACADKLNQCEKENMALGAITLTIELAARFLKDYIDGDKYFKVSYPDHNLVRARNQIKLTSDMLDKFDVMKEIVSKYC